jgi:hypothetical protein
MSNNAAERELRTVAIGRRNWTFAGSDEGGRRAAAIYTIIATAKINDIDPEAWLADVLARLRDRPVKRIRDLLPGTGVLRTSLTLVKGNQPSAQVNLIGPSPDAYIFSARIADAFSNENLITSLTRDIASCMFRCSRVFNREPNGKHSLTDRSILYICRHSAAF